MSREIKFRAWDKDYGFMYQNAYPFEHLVYVEMHDDDETFERFKHKMQVVNGKYFYWIIAKDMELMQFTGMHDKHGKEIYENDLVMRENNMHPHIVLWDKDGFWLKNAIAGGGIDGIDNKRCEIIGNIYENPGLITV